MTAASRTRPLGTQIEVEHRGRRVNLTMTDRGPYVWEQRDRWAESTMGLPAC
jgi:rare lipoprotein A (peptidoglycan hydrolase)